MIDIKAIDTFNVYNSDLSDITESARRTYGEANVFFNMSVNELIALLSEMNDHYLPAREVLYDEVNAIASILAASCEMYLKAIYLYEHRDDGVSVDELWDKMRSSEFKKDEFGDNVYEKELPTGEKVNVFVMRGADGSVIRDRFGKPLYCDKYNNAYTEGDQGRKIKMSGHDLDRLINMLSPETIFMLESRMKSIAMNETAKNKRISIVDIMELNKLLSRQGKVSREDYLGWVDMHKKTFEEARYAGQKRRTVSIEFLHHLATQIKAVAQYKLDPRENQIFTLSEEELKAQPEEIKILAKENPRLISQALVRAMASDESMRNKFSVLMTRKYRFDLNTIGAGAFYRMLENCTEKEIEDISFIGYLRDYKGSSDLLDRSMDKTIKSVREFLRCMNKLDVNMDTLVMYYLDLKRLGFEEVTFGDLKTVVVGMAMSNNALAKAYYMGYEFGGFDDDEEISELVRKIICNKRDR